MLTCILNHMCHHPVLPSKDTGNDLGPPGQPPFQDPSLHPCKAPFAIGGPRGQDSGPGHHCSVAIVSDQSKLVHCLEMERDWPVLPGGFRRDDAGPGLRLEWPCPYYVGVGLGSSHLPSRVLLTHEQKWSPLISHLPSPAFFP